MVPPRRFLSRLHTFPVGLRTSGWAALMPTKHRNSTMEYRRLGKSGLKVSELSFGSWVTFGKQVDGGDAVSLMGYAYDQGINFFDNAEGYEQGNSEVVMGEALK